MTNPEYKIQFKQLGKLLWVCSFALLYALGGIDNLWLRRYMAPCWLGLGMYLFSKDWRKLLQVPLLIGALHLGYGASELWQKIIKRFLFGFAAGFSSITHLFDIKFDKRNFWTLFSLALTVTPAITITLGVINPVVARAEELIIGFFIGLWPMYMTKES